jgi:hypothetical protein
MLLGEIHSARRERGRAGELLSEAEGGTPTPQFVSGFRPRGDVYARPEPHGVPL